MVDLTKGQKVALTKADGSDLSKVRMGLGWDVAKGLFGGGGASIDLDASVLVFDANGNILENVYFGNKRAFSNAITHNGDNLTGAGDGDDETIDIDLSKLPANANSLIFTINSFCGQTFDKVANAFCRLMDDRGTEAFKFNLSAKGAHTALVVAKVYRHNGSWKIHAIGDVAQGRTSSDMASICRNYTV